MSEAIKSKQFTFKLRSGSHCYIDANGKTVTIEPKGILNTDIDMAKVEGPDRWELLESSPQDSIEDLKARIRALESMVPAQPSAPVVEDTEDNLDKMSVSALRKMAAELEPPVDLSTCNGKTEIINAIRSAMDAA